MLILDDSPAFICLEYILTEEYGYTQSNVYVENYVYFQKYNLPPIQVNSLQKNYTDLESSSYAIQVGECVEKFIDRFAWVMETLERLSKKSKN